MARRAFPLSQVYRLLEPGPVVLLTTAGKRRPNIMTQSWHTMIDFEPPLVGCVISNRNHAFKSVMRTRECVISVPTIELARPVVKCGNTSERAVNNFEAFHLTPKPASLVGAPLIAECYAALECKVIDDSMARRYNLSVLEVLAAWMDRSRKRPRTIHHLGRGAFMVSGKTIRLPSRMK